MRCTSKIWPSEIPSTVLSGLLALGPPLAQVAQALAVLVQPDGRRLAAPGE
jgi:hypothetical protein